MHKKTGNPADRPNAAGSNIVKFADFARRKAISRSQQSENVISTANTQSRTRESTMERRNDESLYLRQLVGSNQWIVQLHEATTFRPVVEATTV